MNRKLIFQSILVLALLSVAGVLGFGYWHNQTVDSTEKVYFYDLGQQQLFGAARSSVPPIAGLDGRVDGAVRAIVITPTGNPREKKQVSIAYLEKYTPEMKALFESLRQTEAAGKSTAGMIPHGMVPRSTQVRRLKRYSMVSHDLCRRRTDCLGLERAECGRPSTRWYAFLNLISRAPY